MKLHGNIFFSEMITEVDEVAEWLRRWTANPMGSARVGSNPILVEIFFQTIFSALVPLQINVTFWR